MKLPEPKPTGTNSLLDEFNKVYQKKELEKQQVRRILTEFSELEIGKIFIRRKEIGNEKESYTQYNINARYREKHRTRTDDSRTIKNNKNLSGQKYQVGKQQNFIFLA